MKLPGRGQGPLLRLWSVWPLLAAWLPGCQPASSAARSDQNVTLALVDRRNSMICIKLFKNTTANHELAALHECLAWGREPGNDPVLRFYGQTFEDFSDACRTLAAKWKHLLPTGNNRVKVRMTGKDRVKNVKESTLGSTLGEETCGLCVFDYEVFSLCLFQM